MNCKRFIMVNHNSSTLFGESSANLGALQFVARGLASLRDAPLPWCIASTWHDVTTERRAAAAGPEFFSTGHESSKDMPAEPVSCYLPKVATPYSSIFMPHQTPSLATRFGTTACFMLYHADDGDDSSWCCWTSIGAGSMVAPCSP